MPSYFLDSSALVKQYIEEVGSSWVIDVLNQYNSRIFIARLAAAEVSSAFVRRGLATCVSELLDQFDKNFENAYLTVHISDIIVDFAVKLVRKHRLRGCDGIQLAAALSLIEDSPDLIFVCCDEELNNAARAEGLEVENPNDHIS
jgi:predicted nucleic acid-binding protein